MDNNATNTNTHEREIDLKSIIDLLLSKIIWILAATVTGLLVMFYISSYVITPKYTASVRLYIDPGEGYIENKSQLDFSRSVVASYIVLLESGMAREAVAQGIAAEISPGSLKSYVTMSSVNNTEVLEIKAITSNPELSAEICNIYADKAPKLIADLTKNKGSVTLVESAQIPTSPSSPNNFMYSVVGGLLAFLVTAVIIILVDTLDNTVKDSEQLQKRFALPVLGQVPSILTENKGGYGYGEKKETSSL